MYDVKPWYRSTGVAGGIVCLLGAVMSLLGLHVSSEDTALLCRELTTIAGSVGGIMALIGRLKATAAIGKPIVLQPWAGGALQTFEPPTGMAVATSSSAPAADPIPTPPPVQAGHVACGPLAWLLLLSLALSLLVGCAVPSGQATSTTGVVSAAQVQAAGDYLGASLTNMTAGYSALLAAEAVAHPARAAEIKAQGDGLLTQLEVAVQSYQAAAASSQQIQGAAQTQSAWMGALDALSRVAAVVGPYALASLAGL